jgi:hypothetical protein
VRCCCCCCFVRVVASRWRPAGRLCHLRHVASLPLLLLILRAAGDAAGMWGSLQGARVVAVCGCVQTPIDACSTCGDQLAYARAYERRRRADRYQTHGARTVTPARTAAQVDRPASVNHRDGCVKPSRGGGRLLGRPASASWDNLEDLLPPPSPGTDLLPQTLSPP